MQDIFTIALISMASHRYYYRAFSRLDLEYEIVEMPRARLSSMIAEGTLPVGVSSVKTPERAEHSYFIPYLAQRNEILVRADADVSTEEEFLNNKNLKFGIVRGYYYGEYYEELIERLKKRIWWLRPGYRGSLYNAQRKLDSG